MKIIFRIDGSNFFVEELPVLPPLTSTILIYGSSYKVVNVILDLNSEEDSEVKYYTELKPYAELKPTDVETNTAKCIKVWDQNRNSLTLGREYKILRIFTSRWGGQYFEIIDDLGRQKKYQINNTQFDLNN